MFIVTKDLSIIEKPSEYKDSKIDDGLVYFDNYTNAYHESRCFNSIEDAEKFVANNKAQEGLCV